MPHQPTRLPYGISYVKPGVSFDQYTFVAGDITPDVSYGTFFVTGASSLSIANFDGGELGKNIFVYSNSGGSTTIINSVGAITFNNIVSVASGGAQNIFTLSATGGNLVMLNRECLEFMHTGSGWAMVGNRFVLSTQV